MSTGLSSEPNPGMILDAINGYQRSAALKAAIELDVFTEVARGSRRAEAIAKGVGASTRGIRILCDYLVIIGFLSKASNEYSLNIDSATFLDRNSPAYFGSMLHFLLDPRLIGPFVNLPHIVRAGTTTLPESGTVTQANPLWVEFAKHMTGAVYPSAVELAKLVAGDGQIRLLDVAAGHGLFGITIAQRNPHAFITALDWPHVLAVASANAEKYGVADRYSTLAGNAFEVEFDGPYDLILVTGFFHHFDPPTCERLMRKILGALAHGGTCVTLDFVPNEDRVSPPIAAGFAMMMLATTPSGDAYTFAEYDRMFGNAGFAASRLQLLTTAPQAVIVSRKD